MATDEQFLVAALHNIESAERVGQYSMRPDERAMLDKVKPILQKIINNRKGRRKAETGTERMF